MEIRRIDSGELVAWRLRTFEYREEHADDTPPFFQCFTNETPCEERPGLFQADDGGFKTLLDFALETDQPMSLTLVLGTMRCELKEVSDQE